MGSADFFVPFREVISAKGQDKSSIVTGQISNRDRTNLQKGQDKYAIRQDKFTILAGQIYKTGQIVKS